MHEQLVEVGRYRARRWHPLKQITPERKVIEPLEQVKCLILELGMESRKLSGEIEAEETRSRISDPQQVAYSPLARALRERRDRLARSIDTLAESLEHS
jgi:hypothetical protein